MAHATGGMLLRLDDNLNPDGFKSLLVHLENGSDYPKSANLSIFPRSNAGPIATDGPGGKRISAPTVQCGIHEATLRMNLPFPTRQASMVSERDPRLCRAPKRAESIAANRRRGARLEVFQQGIEFHASYGHH